MALTWERFVELEALMQPGLDVDPLDREARSGLPVDLELDGDVRPGPDCGTRGGYAAHLRTTGVACDECKAANNAYARAHNRRGTAA